MFKKRIYLNHQIKALKVRVIDEKGQQLGILSLTDALRLSREKGFDLVEIAPQANPPVCKIIDYGKYLYEQKRKERKKERPKQIEVKGVRFGLNTGDHDLLTVIKKAEKFLDEGDRVKIEIMLRGREKKFASVARKKMEEFIKLINQPIKIDSDIKRTPSGFQAVVSQNKEKS
ncbi:MAG TPA: translation initiation factor IF-3 [Candidatus Portnoybacteria bacterium]|nr:translation initiation factor IF-3 [Candidatus Portnoybacteria bacterium]